MATKALPMIGTKDWTMAVQEDVRTAMEALEAKWGGQVWSHASFLFEAHSKDTQGRWGATTYAVGHEINLLCNLAHWMDEVANHRFKAGKIPSVEHDMTRMIEAFLWVVAAKEWPLTGKRITDPSIYTGSAIPDPPPL